MISHVLKSRLEALNLQSSNLSDKFILWGMQGQLCWHCSCAKFEFVRQVDVVWDARTVLFLHYSFAKFELVGQVDFVWDARAVFVLHYDVAKFEFVCRTDLFDFGCWELLRVVFFTQPVRLELCLVSLFFCKVRVCKTSFFCVLCEEHVFALSFCKVRVRRTGSLCVVVCEDMFLLHIILQSSRL